MKIGQLDLVYHLFGEIQIPEAVFNELISNSRFKLESIQIQKSSFVKVSRVIDIKAVDALRTNTGLDVGESEAIVLSNSIGADILLMDEVKGRQVAQQMGINIMGTVGLLMVAYGEQILSKEEIMKCIEVLRSSGRHISEKLYKQLINKLEDEKDN
jgi:predicted nucleic acid-binding protein